MCLIQREVTSTCTLLTQVLFIHTGAVYSNIEYIRVKVDISVDVDDPHDVPPSLGFDQSIFNVYPGS